MKDIIKIFDENKKINNDIKGISVKYIGHEETNKVFKDARNIFIELYNKYTINSSKEQVHTNLIFAHIALYRALCVNHQDIALKIMEEGEAISAIKVGKTYNKIVSLPFGKSLFFKCFASGCKKGFGKEAGFTNKVYTATLKEYKMDIICCPYAKYCNLEDYKELIQVFCNNDIYAYGNLKGIKFIREQTLANGDKCDFYLVKDKNQG